MDRDTRVLLDRLAVALRGLARELKQRVLNTDATADAERIAADVRRRLAELGGD